MTVFWSALRAHTLSAYICIFFSAAPAAHRNLECAFYNVELYTAVRNAIINILYCAQNTIYIYIIHVVVVSSSAAFVRTCDEKNAFFECFSCTHGVSKTRQMKSSRANGRRNARTQKWYIYILSHYSVFRYTRLGDSFTRRVTLLSNFKTYSRTYKVTDAYDLQFKSPPKRQHVF